MLAPLDPRIVTTLTDLLAAATASADLEPTAMSLATCDGGNRVDLRTVLLKGIDARGLRFFSNYHSAKGRQLEKNPHAAVCLHWRGLLPVVQVRAEGLVEKLPSAESDAYFASRGRSSQIGAWASLQSQVLPDRATFEARVAQYESEFKGRDIPRPPHWGGYLLRPDRVEFWYGAEGRLHERVNWHCDSNGAWSSSLLYP